jgi:hypothetical protein
LDCSIDADEFLVLDRHATPSRRVFRWFRSRNRFSKAAAILHFLSNGLVIDRGREISSENIYCRRDEMMEILLCPQELDLDAGIPPGHNRFLSAGQGNLCSEGQIASR